MKSGKLRCLMAEALTVSSLMPDASGHLAREPPEGKAVVPLKAYQYPGTVPRRWRTPTESFQRVGLAGQKTMFDLHVQP